MSRCVKNLRREGTAANGGPKATQTGKIGTSRTVQSVSKNTGRERRTAMPNYENQTNPQFNQAPKVLSKFDGH